MACYALPLALVGARLYYVAFSGQTYTFWQVFEVWKGGMALYGGIIGGAVGVVLYCLIHKKNFLLVADVAVVGLILGQGLGRIGCYFSSCCYGVEITNESLMWFPFATQIDGVWHLSTFFFECFFDILTFVALFVLIRKMKKPGSMLGIYLICYGIIRCVLEGFRDTAEALFIGNSGIRVSQLISGILIVIGIVLLLVIYLYKRKNKKNDA